MLILTRKPGESLYIGDDIKVIIVEIKGNQIRVGIEAPSDVRIYREEIYLQILEENRKAAEVTSDEGLAGLSEAWKGKPGAGAPSGASLLMGGAKPAGGLKPAAPRTGEVPPAPAVVVKRKKGGKRREDEEDDDGSKGQGE